MSTDPVTGADIDAYLDGELDLTRRLTVEQYLADHPDAAAQFMADLQIRTSLRLLLAETSDAPDTMVEAADQLGEKLAERRGSLVSRLGNTGWMRGLAAAALVGVIFVPLRNVVASPPSYVGDAVQAYHTGLLRARLVSQIETPAFDAHEIRSRAHIRMPRLPKHWVVTDAQIFPSEQGPALQLMVRTPEDGEISIFAVRSQQGEAPNEPTAIRHDGAAVAYWRDGDMSYAVTGTAEPEALDAAATNLASETAV